MSAAQGLGRDVMVGRSRRGKPCPIGEGSPLRLICCAGAALTLAGAIVLSAVPAFAATPVIKVTPSTATPGASVTFEVTCGSSATSATLFGAMLGLSEQIPMQATTLAGGFATTVDLPKNITPGTYKPTIDCSNGNSGTATLVVHAAASPSATPSHAPATPTSAPATPTSAPATPTSAPATPSGAPGTGDGATSTMMGGPFEVAGIGLVGIGVLAGVIAFGRRRRSGPGA